MTSFGEYVRSLKSIYGASASMGVLVPGIAILMALSPPMIPGLSVFVSALSAATLVLVFHYESGHAPHHAIRKEGRLRQARAAFAAAALLVLVYAGMLMFLTVSEAGERFQIGFYKLGWSLTPEGLSVRSAHPALTPKQWMMNDALFSDDGPAVIWRQWSRYLAFASMYIVFSVTCVVWTLGWGLLAKEHAELSER